MSDIAFCRCRNLVCACTPAVIKTEKAYAQIKSTQELNRKLKEIGVSLDYEPSLAPSVDELAKDHYLEHYDSEESLPPYMNIQDIVEECFKAGFTARDKKIKENENG